MTVKILDSLFSDPDRTEFPFEISREEMEIVKDSNSAAFIIGRSGTGKTTCLLFKLLCRNIASRALNNERPVRQVCIKPHALPCIFGVIDRDRFFSHDRAFSLKGSRIT